MVIKAIHFRILIITAITVIVLGLGAGAYVAGLLDGPLTALGIVSTTLP